MLTPLCFSTLEACGGDEASIRAFAEQFAAHGLAIGNVNAGGSLTAAASADRNRESLHRAIEYAGWVGAEVVNGALSEARPRWMSPGADVGSAGQPQAMASSQGEHDRL